MRALKRAFVTVLLAIAVAYGGALVWLVSQETELVFQAGALGSGRPEAPFEQVDVRRTDGARQFAWVLPRPGHDRWVLYLHGNASTVASRLNLAHYARLRSLGLNVFAPEYRGYGGLDGVPSEASLALDARAAYDYLCGVLRVPSDRLIIYGWSLGSAVAVTLAAEVPSAGVILEGAPASLVDIGQSRYPFFPIRMLMRNPFDSIDRIGRIRAPLLFLHSPEDAVIPVEEGRRLFAAAPEPKTFVEVRGGHVNASEVDAGVFYDAVRVFTDRRGRK